MTTITIEGREEFEKLCSKIVFDNMSKLPASEDAKMVEVMMKLFDIGVSFGKDGCAVVEI